MQYLREAYRALGTRRVLVCLVTYGPNYLRCLTVSSS